MTAANRPEGKAAGFNSSVAVARELVGDARWRAFVADLPPEDAELIEHPPLAPSWVPLDRMLRIQAAMWRELFGNAEDKVFELGESLYNTCDTCHRKYQRGS